MVGRSLTVKVVRVDVARRVTCAETLAAETASERECFAVRPLVACVLLLRLVGRRESEPVPDPRWRVDDEIFP